MNFPLIMREGIKVEYIILLELNSLCTKAILRVFPSFTLETVSVYKSGQALGVLVM